jgi:hypothetical protein
LLLLAFLLFQGVFYFTLRGRWLANFRLVDDHLLWEVFFNKFLNWPKKIWGE